MKTARPNPFQWLWYAFGGTLPARCREWVRHDLTRPSWLIGFAVRSVLRMLPLLVAAVLILVLLLDAPLALAAGSASIGFVVAVYYALSYAVERAEVEIAKYGYPLGTAARLRSEREAIKDPERKARYDAAWRQPDA